MLLRHQALEMFEAWINVAFSPDESWWSASVMFVKSVSAMTQSANEGYVRKTRVAGV